LSSARFGENKFTVVRLLLRQNITRGRLTILLWSVRFEKYDLE